ncbi:hypothetical protein [Longimycelium tulufanense]|nr:hypothetical protein [Longimycelium tulufanense]
MARHVPPQAADVRENGHVPPGQPGVAFVGLPAAWHHRDGFTFRWGRGDKVVTVHQGRHLASYSNTFLVDALEVGRDWDDDNDVAHIVRWWFQHRREQVVGTPRQGGGSAQDVA